LPAVTELSARFKTQFPRATFLAPDHLEGLEPLLRSMELLQPSESIVRTEKPGEGNMNFVLRVVTTEHSFILKQSRPWVEKYPQIAAPVERLEAEAAYYGFTSRHPVIKNWSPALLAINLDHLVMITEDLGAGSDLTSIYQSNTSMPTADSRDLFAYLAELHRSSLDADPTAFPANQELKQLNHAHIFDLPFRSNNGFDLDAVQPGLSALARPVVEDTKLQARLRELGELYLGAGPVLIHGDFYPGSWLQTAKGIQIIDPEFAYFGHAEFDLGVMIGHLLMAQTPMREIKLGLEGYLQMGTLDHALVAGFAGAEILRRLIGLAQIPVDLSWAEKRNLIDRGTMLVMSGHSSWIG
jgi:5-methylthioribose kinase